MTIKNIVAIGISTGGPTALAELIRELPAFIDAPILVVQHMPVGFTKMFASRLNCLSKLTVKEACDGDLIEKNTVYIAKGGVHMEVVCRSGSMYIHLSDSEKISGHKPSVDKLFFSLLNLDSKVNVTSVLMTGMGSDGAKGMSALRKKGAYTIIQDEHTSVVFGMPLAAKKLGAAVAELPLSEIAGEIVRVLEV